MDKLLPLVSVIVPVYNGEIFLEKCLKSVICQSYTNIEIIVVNDGSIDNTSLIIDRYVKLDKRIIGLEQKNGGPALARNKGLKIAKGLLRGNMCNIWIVMIVCMKKQLNIC